MLIAPTAASDNTSIGHCCNSCRSFVLSTALLVAATGYGCRLVVASLFRLSTRLNISLQRYVIVLSEDIRRVFSFAYHLPKKKSGSVSGTATAWPTGAVPAQYPCSDRPMSFLSSHDGIHRTRVHCPQDQVKGCAACSGLPAHAGACRRHRGCGGAAHALPSAAHLPPEVAMAAGGSFLAVQAVTVRQARMSRKHCTMRTAAPSCAKQLTERSLKVTVRRRQRQEQQLAARMQSSQVEAARGHAHNPGVSDRGSPGQQGQQQDTVHKAGDVGGRAAARRLHKR